MDARLVRAAFLVGTIASFGASFRTTNFVVNAPTPEIAQRVASAAEGFRHTLAIEWIGKPMPPWSQPCPITVEIGQQLGAGGATSFVFDHGEVFGWQMNIQGPLDRVLDSVLPHEVTHTIIASHFRCPLPRWADEGACTTVEYEGERDKQQKMLIAFLKSGRGIPFSQMFAMKDYPRDILPLYAQGHSLATYLLARGGRQKFLAFVRDGLQNEQWTEAVRRNYGYANLAELQDKWLDWVKLGSPPISVPDAAPGMIAANAPAPGDLVVRAQSADAPAPASVAANEQASVDTAAAWHARGQSPAAPSASLSTPSAAREPQVAASAAYADDRTPSVYAPSATLRR
ncbi:MAG TPA: hypothetical protein VHV77_18545 [Pirellulales bacterium]|jgi:hypothetical protein|nr:hypothetical protein [Pirellulales bacterium]